MIGVDWGTSNLRAFRFDARGKVIDTRRAAAGVATVSDGNFEKVLSEAIGDWLAEDRELVLAGMVGSRSGWLEAPYLACPVELHALAQHLAEPASSIGRCRIVPGVSSMGQGGRGDVMRGEETQLLGAGLDDGVVLLPGTHSKWATLDQGRLRSFRTAMTGELFAVLLEHSLLGRQEREPDTSNMAAFKRGVLRSLDDPSLVMTLFSARAEVLLGSLAPDDVPDYLSGLLIGAEVSAMAPAQSPVTIVGEPGLAQRYRDALIAAGVEAVSLLNGEQAAARGLWMIGAALR